MPEKRYKQFRFDKLQMYFAEPYVIDVDDAEGQVVVHQPTIGDIVRIGEKRFYGTLNIFITNTTAHRLLLWNVGIDWNVFTDFQLFTSFYTQIDDEVSKLIFPDLSFANFELFQRTTETEEGKVEEVIMKDRETGVEITEEVYQRFAQYLRHAFTSFPEEKITDDPVLKQWFINKDERELKRQENGKTKENSLLPVISSCVNHPGFKYSVEQLREIPIYQFFDSVARLQVYENTTAVLKGMYSGFVDASKLKPDSYNFMRDI